MLVSFGAVVGDAGSGLAADCDDRVQLARHAQAGDRGIGNQRQALAGEVIDHGEDAEPPAVGEGIRDEVERPALVRRCWQFNGPTCAERPLAAAASAHLKLLLAVEPPELLLVHGDTTTREHDLDAAVAEPSPLACDLTDRSP
jgi:hypothetical protein